MRIVLAAALIAAAAPAADRERVPVATPVVPPVACINLNQIRETQVRDDRTVDFMLRNGRVLRNTLPFACPGLRFERSFGYSTSLNQLCSTDLISVLRGGGGVVPGARCGLGLFQPVTLIKAKQCQRADAQRQSSRSSDEPRRAPMPCR